jgi:glycerol-3-phosphate acyltransferase PlsY
MIPRATVLALAYLAGSVPFSNLVAHQRASVDLRDVGSGTVSGSSLMEVAGFGPLAVAGVADVAKGAVGPLLAGPDRPVLAALAGGVGVCGHNWSIWLRGAGGRGISPAIGALLVGHWLGALTLLAGLSFRAVRATGLGGFVADMAVVPVLARTDGRSGAMAGAGVVIPMLAKRLLGNNPPVDRDLATYGARLVLDRGGWTRPWVWRGWSTARRPCRRGSSNVTASWSCP